MDDFLKSTGAGKSGLDGWYEIKRNQIEQNQDVVTVIKTFNGYLSSSLKGIYPEHAWEEWRFGEVPNGFWSDPANKRRFFESLLPKGEKLDWWYSRTSAWVLRHRGGAGALSARKSDLQGALTEAYPEHTWKLWLFKGFDVTLLKDISLQRGYFDYLESELGITSKEDWYPLSASAIARFGGKDFLDVFYQGSLAAGLQALYKDHGWQIWKFSRPGFPWWTSRDAAKEFLDQFSKENAISSLEDWYYIKMDRGSPIPSHIRQQGFDLARALQVVFPDHAWEMWRFGTQRVAWSPQRGRRSIESASARQERPKSSPPPSSGPISTKQDAIRDLYKNIIGKSKSNDAPT
jgi:hypothetical protein